MAQEIRDYTDVLLGRVDPPIDRGALTLMEVAEAYHARAREMEMILLAGEREGIITRGSKAYRFRTGELRSFVELAKGAIQLGSRRITAMQLQLEDP